MTVTEQKTLTYDPPRFWWTKRIAGGSILLLLVVILFVVGATSVSQRRLDALIETYRTAGEPVYVDDFNVRQSVPEHQNAAKYYQQAELAYIWPTDIDTKITLTDLYQRGLNADSGRYASEAQRLISTNGSTLELLNKAGQCDDAEWGLRLTRPLINLWLPNLRASRDMAKLLSVNAVRAHAKGRDVEAVESLISVQRLSDHRAISPPDLIGHLVALSISAVACTTVERIGHELAADAEASMRNLMDELLDESALRSSFLVALAYERAALIDTVDLIGQGQPFAGYPTPPPPLRQLVRPILIEHSRQCAEFFAAIMDAATMESHAQVRKFYPDEEAFLHTGINSVLPGAVYIPSLERATTLEFMLRADRRMAALVLAIRLYELDHGQLPQTLNDLVPTYIAAVPKDPFSDELKPLGYKPDAEPPVLYSVGHDGIDDHGTFELKKGGNVDRDKLDFVFFLNGDRPRAKP